MLIEKIKLANIRSYNNAEIDFPEGSILLSGNIGSGKSTILLAIDFALFGISRDLPGTALLRNGEKEGSVELHFKINDKKIVVKRVLKRSVTSVSQDTGELTVEGEKNEFTAMELKQRILELLNYPPDLLTKSKSMVYHYTVYSPQEKMKEILLSSNEDRLEILRKVFGIDKYKRVRNNVEIFIVALKQKSKEVAAMVADLEQKLEELSEQKQREEELNLVLKKISPEVIMLKSKYEEKKKSIEVFESELKQYEMLKHEIEKTTISIKHKVSEIATSKEMVETLHSQMLTIQNDLAKLPMADSSLHERISIMEKEIKNLEEQQVHCHKKISSLETIKSNHEKLCNDINSLEECPICQQSIEEGHKKKVSKKASGEIEKLDREILALKTSLEQNGQILTHRKNEVKKLESMLQNQKVIEVKQSDLYSRKKDLEVVEKRVRSSNDELVLLNQKLFSFQSNFKENPLIETELKNKKQELEIISENLRDFEIKKASTDSEIKTLTIIIKKLELEIESKEKLKENIAKLLQLREWLEKQFMNITLIMEKNIMLRVHAELESLIQRWFSALVDSETIKIRIDEEFSPIIEQNGYEIEYLHLSGGEKTAAALAYRLALNQVINTLMSSINTKDILMLDEPTDGFSQEQLDRMRNILEEINTKQTIIVSHDPKVESFVDTVIRLEKSEHTTKVNT